MSYPLDPTPEQMREMGRAALDYLVEFTASQDEQAALDVEGAIDAARSVRAAPPEDGGSFDRLMDTVDLIAAKAYNTTGPGYLPFIPGGGLFTAALGDFLATGINRFVNLWGQGPVGAQIEYNVVRWLCDLFGYGPESRGILTTGGSMANLSALVAARKAKLPEDFVSGTLYVSEQVHASNAKAASIAGFPLENVRSVPVTRAMKMDMDALRVMVPADRAAGRIPFFVIGSAGTTNTGAIDPLPEIADFAEEQDLWMHVDGAYGGFFQLTERGRTAFAGIERADSITLDPHKGLFLPYGTGSLVVRDGAPLREAHFVGQHYLQDFPPEDEIPNFTEYSIELSRDFRGLRVWFPLVLHGVKAFREALDEKLDLARYLYEELSEIPQLEMFGEPELTVVPFRLHEGGDEADKRLLDLINASKRVALSSTILHGRFTIRACILSHRTHRDRIEECVSIVRRVVGDVAGR
ncbi:MAG TPA: pyridoxal-dependent decarboxylase [Actinomycetota bacterium]|nr:pyridoxal-dependent decarboxylase [Actinomycetota bacterium]